MSSTSILWKRVSTDAVTRLGSPPSQMKRSIEWGAWFMMTPPPSPAQVPRQLPLS